VVSLKRWKSNGKTRVMMEHRGREKIGIIFFVNAELSREISIDIADESDIRKIEFLDYETIRKMVTAYWILRALLGKAIFADILDIRCLSRNLKRRIQWRSKDLGIMILSRSITLLKRIAGTNYLFFVLPRTMDMEEVLRRIIDTPESIVRRTKEVYEKYLEVFGNEIKREAPTFYDAVTILKRNVTTAVQLINS